MPKPKNPKKEIGVSFTVKHPEVEADQAELYMMDQRRRAKEQADKEFEHPRQRRKRKNWERIRSRRKVRRAVATKQGRISH